jgi:hypothetical protein
MTPAMPRAGGMSMGRGKEWKNTSNIIYFVNNHVQNFAI